jgi:ribosome-binding factor A
MPDSKRIQRIQDRIRQDLSEMLIRDINDPRLENIFITDVTVDRELAFADIYFSAIEGHERAEEIQKGFKAATGFLRRQLAQNIELRVFPRLRFHWDPTPERSDHIEKILASIRNESKEKQNNQSNG